VSVQIVSKSKNHLDDAISYQSGVEAVVMFNSLNIASGITKHWASEIQK